MGSLEGSLQVKASALGISEQIKFPGFVQEVPRLLGLFDIFVLPSLSEGLPMALLEAMAAKRPVIASAVGSITKLIISGHTGLLVAPGDRIGLEQAICQMLSNRKMAAKFANNAYNTVRTGFNSKLMTNQYKKIYYDLLH